MSGDRMRFGVVAGLAALLLAGALALPGGTAQGAQASGSQLRVYVVVLDGLMPHEVGALTPNLAALKAQGTWYEQARAVFPAETVPNHVAMMTGVLPSRSGIVGNDFWQPGTNASKSKMAHPKLLGAETVVSGLEQRCAVSTATFMSKGYLWGVMQDEATARVAPNYTDFPTSENADHPGKQRGADYHWLPFGRPGYINDPDDHVVDAMVMKAPPTGDYRQPTNQQVDRGGFLTWLASDPPAPHFAFVNLGDVDRSGHVDATGISGAVSGFRRAALADTDTLIGELVAQLKADGTWEDTVLIFTSDHGMDWSVPVMGDNFVTPVRSVDVSATLNQAGYSMDIQGKPGKATQVDPDTKGDYAPVAGGGTAAVYVEEPEDLADMARVLAAHPGVELVATRRPVPGLDTSTLAELGMDHRYNGDIVVMVRPGWAVRDGSSSNPIPGNHGHGATQQSLLMVAGGHPVLDAPQSVGGEKVYDPATGRLFSPPQDGPGNLSVAPTVAALFGLREPAGGYDGQPLSEAFDPGALEANPECAGAPAP